MGDLIDRSELLKMFRIKENMYIMKDIFENEDVYHVDKKIMEEIENFPAASAVNNGFWIKSRYDSKNKEKIKCSICQKEMVETKERAKYCPFCGSIMDEKKRYIYYGEYIYCD